MTVRIPDVAVEQPSVDLGRAQVRQRGLWVSRKAGIALQRQASRVLATTATARARSDENMAKARTAAVAAVAGFVRQPLAAAGFDASHRRGAVSLGRAAILRAMGPLAPSRRGSWAPPLTSCVAVAI